MSLQESYARSANIRISTFTYSGVILRSTSLVGVYVHGAHTKPGLVDAH